VPAEDDGPDLAAGVLGWAAILRSGAAEQAAVAAAALDGAHAASRAAQPAPEAAEPAAGGQRRHR
ncbi:hypothetical protein VM98_34875, partial [Streptomyces rubellomurinus subsp. indigoferus]